MNGERFEELVPLYVVGALDGAELREFENYLRTASEAEKRELRELSEVAAMLPLALPNQAAPAPVKARLFARLETAAPAQAASTPAKIIAFPEKRRFSFWALFALQPASTLLTVATLLLAVTSSWLLWQNSGLRRDRDALAQQVAEKNREIAASQGRLDALASQTTRLISLSGKEAPEANAKVFWDTARNQWVIYIFNLPSAPADKEYQLWYITKDRQKEPSITFRPDANGRGEIRVSVPPKTVPQLSATAITLEPKGGSAQPTGNIYLVGNLGA